MPYLQKCLNIGGLLHFAAPLKTNLKLSWFSQAHKCSKVHSCPTSTHAVLSVSYIRMLSCQAWSGSILSQQSINVAMMPEKHFSVKKIRGLGLGEDDFILLCDILCNFISKLAGLFLESQNLPYEHCTFRFRFLTPPFPNLKSVQRVKMGHSSPFSPISVLSTSSQC